METHYNEKKVSSRFAINTMKSIADMDMVFNAKDAEEYVDSLKEFSDQERSDDVKTQKIASFIRKQVGTSGVVLTKDKLGEWADVINSMKGKV